MKLWSLITAEVERRYFFFLPATFIFLLSCSQYEPRLRSIKTDEGIEILEDESKVLFYQVKPRSMDGKFERSNYIHPLYSLDGNVLTEDFPHDHRHHHGIYSAWHQIILNDKPIADGWTGENISWDVVDTKLTKRNENLTISSEILWKHSVNGGKEPIVKEYLSIIVHESRDKYRIIDYDIELLPLKDSLEIGGSADEKGYGGFSLRLKLPEDIRFVSEEGQVEAKVVSVDAGAWMNFVGSFDGVDAGESGVAVFCHPSNPGSPHPWILRKEKSMQNPAFPGRSPVELDKDGLRLRYRVVIHDGGFEKSKIDELYQEYAQ